MLGPPSSLPAKLGVAEIYPAASAHPSVVRPTPIKSRCQSNPDAKQINDFQGNSSSAPDTWLGSHRPIEVQFHGL
jgi:hypothetical protein